MAAQRRPLGFSLGLMVHRRLRRVLNETFRGTVLPVGEPLAQARAD
jgi:hypothetical protein